MSYIDVTGKTEEAAVTKALEQLGLDRDDVSVEILERAKSGFLGLGSCPAKVRVTYEKEEKSVFTESTLVQETVAPAEKKSEDVPKTSVPVSAEEPSAEPTSEEVNDEKAQAIRKFLTGLLKQLENNASVHVYLNEKGRYKVILEGDKLGQLIGRRGETLDAIQQLTSYSVNRGGGGRVRIQLDAENYRERREQSLIHLAQKVAGKVVKYRHNVTLEPMNAYERHVIHTALQDTANVTTYSTGTEPNRRVIIAYDREKYKAN